jgi:hypothetical protein
MDVKKLTVVSLLLTAIALATCAPPAPAQDANPDIDPDAGTVAEQDTDPVKDLDSATTGLLEIMLTDAPPDLNVEKALVTISSVEVHRAGEDDDGEDDDDKGWITVVETAQTFDLIAVKEAEAFLGSAELAPGKYTQIRLHVEKAVATIDGTEHELKVPSEKIKLNHPFTIEPGSITKLTLDFDAQKSIHQAGRKYMLKPTIKVVTE